MASELSRIPEVEDPDIVIDLVEPAPLWREALPEVEGLADGAARAALAAGEPDLAGAAELSIVLGDDALVRNLNREWRHKDEPTNVLSFASDEPEENGRPRLLGDVILAYETVAREAAAQDKALADHFRHLVVHGVLHLLGYDHIEDAEAERMEGLERNVLAGLGIADPYRTAEAAHG